MKIQFILPEARRGMPLVRNGQEIGTIECVEMTEDGDILVTAEVTNPEMMDAIRNSNEHYSIVEEEYHAKPDAHRPDVHPPEKPGYW